jgi:hypothetical protein
MTFTFRRVTTLFTAFSNVVVLPEFFSERRNEI